LRARARAKRGRSGRRGARDRDREFSHADEVLGDLCETLLALVHAEIGPVLELVIDLLERIVVVFRELDLLPEVGRAVCALDSLDVQEALALVLVDRRVLRVRQGARLPVAQPRNVVLVAAEVLAAATLILVRQLRFERAELLVDDLPNDLIALHRGGRLRLLPVSVL